MCKNRGVRIRCYLPSNLEFKTVSRVLAGVYEQPGARITLHFMEDLKFYPSSVGLEVEGIRFGIELDDHNDNWDRALLSWCDIYAKRNLHPSKPAPFDPEKVVPFGLHCNGRSTRSMLSVIAALGKAAKLSARKRSQDIYYYAATPKWNSFEYHPEKAASHTILFQTRLWHPDEAPGDQVINHQRAEIVRVLKREFKQRFVGGAVPTPFAVANYPELVTSHPSRQTTYIDQAKAHAIGIYSRGLFDSFAFKMAEFLASSKCIVSEPLENTLTAPLDHLDIFNNPDECAALCDALLSKPRLVEEKRRLTWEYYSRNVTPQATIARLLATKPLPN